MDKESYLINQLAERAGVTVRTIRYYVNEGLLPPPQTKGRYSAYDEDYLYRIRLIKFYKESYLPLSRIRERLDAMTSEEIRATVEQYEKEPPDFNLPMMSESQIQANENYSAREYLRNLKEPAPREYHQDNIKVSPSMPSPVPDWLKPNESMNLESRDMDSAPPKPPTTWRRIEVDDGMELLVREDVYRKRRQEIEMLLTRFGRGNRRQT
jgi:DNA-binding transcriptional MerR regulator